jgi:hypothetical protein
MVLAVVTALSLLGCQKEQKVKPAMKTLKVTVSAAGVITVEGQVATLEQVSAKFAELKKAEGGVLYHRENPQGEPPPNAMKVVELVVENQLPIRMCAKPDFSE